MTARKIFIVLSLFFITFTLFHLLVPVVLAADTQPSSSLPWWYPEGNKGYPKLDEINGTGYIEWSRRRDTIGIVCDLSYIDGLCYLPPGLTQLNQLKQRTAMAQVTNLIGATYSYPPASTAYYAMDVGRRLGVPSAYAQGIGSGSLIPLLSLWRAFSNIAYGLIIIVLMAIGIMIMFRVPIDNHTVISVQQALPRVIISMFLIMFSYAIAGFLIDLMYLVIFLSISVISNAMPPNTLPPLNELQSQYVTGGSLQILTNMLNLIPIDQKFKSGTVLTVFLGLVRFTPIGAIGGFLVSLAVGAGINGGGLLPIFGGTGKDDVIATLVGGAISPIVYLLIILAFLFMFVRILFLLINAYIQIILAVVFAPIQILFDAFPMGGNNFSGWLKNLIANLAVFPAIVILLLVGYAINSTIGTPSGAFSGMWVPPMVPAWTPNAVKFVIGFGILMMIPNLVGSLKEVIGGKSPIALGVGAPFAPFISGAQTALSVGQQFYYFGHATEKLRSFTGGKEEHPGSGKR